MDIDNRFQLFAAPSYAYLVLTHVPTRRVETNKYCRKRNAATVLCRIAIADRHMRNDVKAKCACSAVAPVGQEFLV